MFPSLLQASWPLTYSTLADPSFYSDKSFSSQLPFATNTATQRTYPAGDFSAFFQDMDRADLGQLYRRFAMPTSLWQSPPLVHTLAIYGVGLPTVANLTAPSFYTGMPISPGQLGSVSGDTGIPEVSSNSLKGWFGMESPRGCKRGMEMYFLRAKPGEDPMSSAANHINLLSAEEPLSKLFDFLRNVNANCTAA